MEEQKAVASYLDTKTSVIARRIELLSAKSEKYKELRRTLINKTISRGLNPDIPLKESGVEWIGKIPENWEIKRFKSCLSLKKVDS
jgi:type I restriction enzyme S subunit